MGDSVKFSALNPPKYFDLFVNNTEDVVAALKAAKDLQKVPSREPEAVISLLGSSYPEIRIAAREALIALCPIDDMLEVLHHQYARAVGIKKEELEKVLSSIGTSTALVHVPKAA